MKKIMILLMAVLMSFSTSAFAGTTTESNHSSKLTLTIPVNVIVKQTISFNDGKTISIYYQKEGDVCRLYSKTDLTKYQESDLNRIRSTSFEFTDHTEGKCYLTRNLSQVFSQLKSLLLK